MKDIMAKRTGHRSAGRVSGKKDQVIERPPSNKKSSNTEDTEDVVELDINDYSRRSIAKKSSLREIAEPSINSMDIHNDFFAAKQAMVEWLGDQTRSSAVARRSVGRNPLASENVVGVGVGIRDSGGVFTGELAIKVFVREKVSPRRVEKDFVIPDELDGIPTDVSPVGHVRSFSYAFKYDRPVRCGVSCGHENVSAGTIGCLVVMKNRRLGLLSNNHVLANENNARIGDPIFQPGKFDGGTSDDLIATLEAFEPISFTSDNLIDAAVGWTQKTSVSTHHMTYTVNPVPIAAAPLMTVIKNGRTTQATTGWVEAIDVDSISVEYDNGIAKFNNQIVIRGLSGTAFSDKGDSGSLIVTSGSKQPVGLLFAGSATHTFANPIDVVMDRLGIDRIYVKDTA
jgi:hypothetical protein